MATRCLSWRGHRYEARYDEVPIHKLILEGVTGASPEQIRRMAIYSVYVHDICVRCGDVITRKREVS